MLKMKALTLHQPWATLVAEGLKIYETRSWTTNYRGPIAIHAGKHVDLDACEQSDLIRCTLYQLGIDNALLLPRGEVIAVGELVDVIPTEVAWNRVSGEELGFGNFAPGRFAWRINGVRKVSGKISCRGMQGLFTVDLPEPLHLV